MEFIKVGGILIFIFGVLVGIHEFGHFLIAKLVGIWVQEFALGFGPKIFSKRVGDTIYRLNLIPLGGYVKLYGEQGMSFVLPQALAQFESLPQKTICRLYKTVVDNKLGFIEEEHLEDAVEALFPNVSVEERGQLLVAALIGEQRKNDPRRYTSKSFFQRLGVVLGGVAMNFLLGVITYVVYLLIMGGNIIMPNVASYRFMGANQMEVNLPVLGYVDSKNAKELEGAVIISVGEHILSTTDEFVELLKEDWDEELDITFFKNGQVSSGVFLLQGDYDTYYSPGLLNRVIITGVLDESAANLAGLRAGDVVLSIDANDIQTEDAFLYSLKENKGKDVLFKLFRPNEGVIDIEVSLVDSKNDDSPILGSTYYVHTALGVDLYKISYKNPILGGFTHSLNILGYQMKALGEMVKESVAEKDVSIIGENVSSPIGIGSEIASLVQAHNFIDLLNLFGLISLSLAFMNILPLPIVDGGHVVLLILEQLRGRPLSERSQKIYNMIGLSFLLFLSLGVMFKDIVKLVIK